MVSTKLHTAIYVVSFTSATVQMLVEFTGLSYWLAFGVIMVLSAAKAMLVVAHFQHLRPESWSLTYLAYIGFVAALALTLAVSYSPL